MFLIIDCIVIKRWQTYNNLAKYLLFYEKNEKNSNFAA